MLKVFLCTITLFFLNGALYAQNSSESDSLAQLKNLYRHYTGTAGHHHVVLDMRYSYPGVPVMGASTYYFTDEGGLNFFVIKTPSVYAHSMVLNGQVFPENIALSNITNVYSDQVQTSRLSFTISHDSLTGMWLNGNGQEQLPLVLKEDNSGMLPFMFDQAADSMTAIGKKGDTLKAVATYMGIQPSSKMNEQDAVFIKKALARFMGATTHGKGDHDFRQICFQKFFDGLKSATKEGRKLPGSNFTGIFTLFPVYIEDGFLVLQQGGYQYDFDKEAYTDQNRYLCLDLKNKKTLQLDDILVRNSALLSKLLENAFRKKYQLEPGKKLSSLFMADTMPATSNFILVGKGIIFSYSPGSVFRDEEDISSLQEMRLFLSYDELASMLKPEFKTRVGLK